MRNKRDPEWISRPEDKLVCLSTVPSLNERIQQRIIELVDERLDWSYVVWMARSHKVLSLLSDRLEWACPHMVPDLVLAQLRDYVRNKMKSQRLLMMELVRVLEFLENHQLLAIPLLSPLLSVFIYKQLGLRSYSNLEILLPKKEVLKGCELLQTLGYQTISSNYPFQTVRCVDVQSEVLLVCREEQNSYLKLRWDGNRHHFAFPFDLTEMATRLQSIEVMGKKVQTLSTEDLILVLCEQSTRWVWHTLGSIADIAWVLADSRELNWDLMVERAKRYGSQRRLFLGLFLAQEIMSIELPGNVSKRIAGERELGYLAETVYQRLFQKPDKLPHRLRKGFFYFRVKDSLQQKLRDGLRSLFVPTTEDCVFMSLPKWLFLLYYLIRPIRLLGRYVFGWQKGQEDVGFLPSKQSIVARMLDLAQVQPQDVVYDPGCGDGRIVIMAAKRYGVRAVGIDIDPERIAECRIHARREKVEHLVTFVQQDAMQVDLSEASVLILYMPSEWNQLILPKILKELRHGARIVSNDTELGNFTPNKTELVLDERVVPPHFLYLWYVQRQPSEKDGKPLSHIGRGESISA